MYCNKCGVNNEIGATYCKGCGQSLVSSFSNFSQPVNSNQYTEPLGTQNVNSNSNMIFCAKCGSRLDDGIKFCPKCGTGREPVNQVNMVNPAMTTSANDGGIKPKVNKSLSLYIGFISLGVTLFLSWLVGGLLALAGIGYLIKEKNEMEHKIFIRGLVLNIISVVFAVAYIGVLIYLNSTY